MQVLPVIFSSGRMFIYMLNGRASSEGNEPFVAKNTVYEKVLGI